ncbi:MAG: NADP-specific glutamate dehydrogenase [Candidatus Improbicoccus pseudotrichonymphae]|uniref:Glutamate dehydrogenase n=1 Tax=Candidatus Improbicoccus pseudotrichonymphae TaxID=3033792 RepID=A0AA48KZ47_9FIRM|nr:MAG: NADP-specific glutamate dehydrogenase [Candidatus Improbicoccus pseudotrichonymphae]
MSYKIKIKEIIKNVIDKNPGENEFHQTVAETLNSIKDFVETEKKYETFAILERLTEPDRVICFRVNWRDDNGNIRVNKGYRVQFNNKLGPYKGGLRFHPNVNIGIMKFLAFEQTFKNALTGLPLGGAKGGSDFDPKNKSELEIMSFCQNFMNELFRYIGPSVDVPAGDIGVGQREIGYLFGQYKKIKNIHDGAITGKSFETDGLLGRKEATGFGLVYFTEEMLRYNSNSLEGKVVCISGSGNVAIYTAQKAIEYGAKVITMSDSDGWVFDEQGIDITAIKEIKENKKLRIYEYQKIKPNSKYFPGRFDWSVKCDVAMPCATQNEILMQDAINLVKNGCIAVSEGANMPTNIEATEFLIKSNVLFGPAKAANAGGVSVSGLEMSQNSSKLKWEFEDVDIKLKKIMKQIFTTISTTAEEHEQRNNYLLGANLSAFSKVSKSMLEQGF